jgi:tRNA A-37 threonylcarbamoyl transferase component Bud32
MTEQTPGGGTRGGGGGTESADQSTTVRVDSTPTGVTAPIRILANRYALRSELGHGGMGVVWRADDTLIGRQVAIKELRLPRDLGSAELDLYRERLLREARSAGRLSDPAIVTVHDVLQADGSVYIVMELVEAPTLARLVRERGPLDGTAVADLGRQLLAALGTAHAAGIVHRDVKPSNVMVLANGRVKLTDFGIAHAADDPTLTAQGVSMGSPAYMAPEVLSGKPATPASDLWALGGVLYFASEGRGAFERGSTAATLHAVVNEVPYLTNGQGAVAAAILGLLTPNPAGRLTAQQANTLFETVLAEHRPLATATAAVPDAMLRQLTNGGRPPRGGARLRASITAVAAVVLLVAGLLIGVQLRSDSSGGGPGTPELAGGLSMMVLTYGEGTSQIPAFGANQAGDCGSGSMPFKAGYSYNSVSCQQGHDFKTYDSYDPASDSGSDKPAYPGLTALAQGAAGVCALDAQLQGWWTPPATNTAAPGATSTPLQVGAAGQPDARQARLAVAAMDAAAAPTPSSSTYQYAALVPSKSTWQDSSTNGSTVVYCVAWSNAGQLPAEPSSG